MRAQRKIHVHDRVSSAHPPIDHRPWSEAIDDPGLVSRPALQGLRDRIKRCAPPAGEPLDFVDFPPPPFPMIAMRRSDHRHTETRARPAALPRVADLARMSASAVLLLFAALG